MSQRTKQLGKNSVVRERAQKKNIIVKPGGTKVPEPKTSTAKKKVFSDRSVLSGGGTISA